MAPRFTAWRKSSRSNGNQACVAIALSGAKVGIRDTKNPDGPVLVLPAPAWDALRTGLR
ncbi:DUF397 domain-containing protein [Actinokineospora soli]|uniref:DUF397 domain-containing protein n=1 Tax=Actinokineospora soli TaxID=1048753 RepID=A0ABW2TJV9_9PSEU